MTGESRFDFRQVQDIKFTYLLHSVQTDSKPTQCPIQRVLEAFVEGNATAPRMLTLRQRPKLIFGVSQFESRPGHRMSKVRLFVASLSPCGTGHDGLLPHPLQFIIHQSSNHSTLLSLATERVVKQTTKKQPSNAWSYTCIPLYFFMMWRRGTTFINWTAKRWPAIKPSNVSTYNYQSFPGITVNPR
jgi:hypothetical protein